MIPPEVAAPAREARRGRSLPDVVVAAEADERRPQSAEHALERGHLWGKGARWRVKLAHSKLFPKKIITGHLRGVLGPAVVSTIRWKSVHQVPAGGHEGGRRVQGVDRRHAPAG